MTSYLILFLEAIERHYEWNGLVEGATDLLATGTALLASLLNVNWLIWGEMTMGSLSLLATITLLIASYSRIIYVAYAAHVLYRSTYAFVITIARWVELLGVVILLFEFPTFSSQIAIHIDYESYGLIFGFNTLLALILEAILAAIVNSWLELNVRVQVSKQVNIKMTSH